MAAIEPYAFVHATNVAFSLRIYLICATGLFATVQAISHNKRPRRPAGPLAENSMKVFFMKKMYEENLFKLLLVFLFTGGSQALH